MDDHMIMDALAELAKRAGLIGTGEALCVTETEVLRALAQMCLAPSPQGKHRVVLGCIEPRGHAEQTPHSWERAFVGAVTPRTLMLDRSTPCRAVAGCIHEAGHPGDHETPRRCPVRFGARGGHTQCHQNAGHEGRHGGVGPMGPLEWDDTGALYPPADAENDGPPPHPTLPRT